MDNNKSMQYLRTYRKEIKYVVSMEVANRINKELKMILKSDEHNGSDGYIIRSLYFDSYNNYDYFSKMSGNENRKKIRLRIYGSSNTCKLELKQKYANNQLKESLVINKDDAECLLQKDYSVLKKYFDENELATRLYAMMNINLYKPVAIIDYNRIAYTYPMYDLRVTIDSDIKSSETNFNIFDKNIAMLPETKGIAILEIKYSGKLMKFVSDILKKYNITQTSYSKYVVGRKIFSHYL